MRQVAQEQFADVAKLNEVWSPGEHCYEFLSWDEFEREVVAELFSDYEVDGRLNSNAHFRLLNFVRNAWLKEWHLTVRKILDKEGLSSPLSSARHNYNFVPDFSLIPWETLDICGKKLYTHEFSDAYEIMLLNDRKFGSLVGSPSRNSPFGSKPLPMGFTSFGAGQSFKMACGIFQSVPLCLLTQLPNLLSKPLSQFGAFSKGIS